MWGRMLKIGMCLVMIASMFFGAWGMRNPGAADGEATVIYVSPDGAGEACTEAAPCALTAGRDMARTLTAGMDRDIHVVLRGGTYRMNEPLVLTAADSGQNGFKVVYMAYPGETPVLSGGDEVTGWQLHDADKGIYSAPVSESFATRQLYVDGKRAARAKGPVPAGLTKTETGHTTTDLTLQNWGNLDKVEFLYRNSWSESRCQIQSVTGGNIEMRPTCWKFLPLSGRGLPVAVENAYELLDQPGEWYLDETANVLYYKPLPGQQMNQVQVIAPLAETLLKGEGTLAQPVRDIEIRGITFAYATWMYPSGPYGFRELQANLLVWDGQVDKRDFNKDQKTEAAVTFNNARGITLERNVFEHLGAAGLEIEGGSQSNLVQGNIFRDLSGTGILLGGVEVEDHHPTSPERRVKDNVIQNNVVHDIGAEFPGAVGIWAGYTENTLIAHNEVFNVPYSGISIGWGWGNADKPGDPTSSLNNKIIANHVHHHMRTLYDGGGIYSLGEQRGMEIKGNVVHDQRNEYGAFYLDDGSQHITLEGNVAYRNMRNLFAKGRDHRIIGNYWDSDRRQLNNATESTWSNNTVAPAGTYPPAIVANAGLTPAYYDLLGRRHAPHEAIGSAVYVHNGQGSLLSDADQAAALSAVDGDLTTVAAVTYGGPWSLTVDTGEVKPLEALVLSFGEGGVPASYKVETSGTSGWTVEGNALAGHPGRIVVPLGGRDIRSIRITTLSGAMSVAEVEAYAAGTPVPLPQGFTLRTADAAVYESDAPAVSVGGTVLTGDAVGEATLTESGGGGRQFAVSVQPFAAPKLLVSTARIAIGRSAQAMLTGVTSAGLIVPFDPPGVAFSSSQPTFIAAASDGTLSALAAGQASIQGASSQNGTNLTDSLTLEAFAERADKVEASLPVPYLHPGENATIDYRVLYDSGYEIDSADLEAVGFESADPSVATVNAEGVVTAVGQGHTVLIVRAEDGAQTVEATLDLYVYPPGWNHANVGQVARGEARYADGKWTIRSSGEDIYGTYDEFGFVYKQINMADYPTGVSVTGTIYSIDDAPVPTTMTGLMLRKSLTSGSPNVNYRVYSFYDMPLRAAPFVYRTSEDAASGAFAMDNVPMPVKIRLTYGLPDRNVYAHYFDEASGTWKPAGSIHYDLGTSFLVGMAHTSKDPNEFSESTFSDIVVSPAEGIPLGIRATTHLLQQGGTLPLETVGVQAGRELRYTSSKPSVATVDANGVVTGVGPGNATITVEDGTGADVRADAIRISVYAQASDLVVANRALNKPSAGVANDLRGVYQMHDVAPAANGNDGNPATYAQSKSAWAWSYKIDLGSQTLLDELKVTFKDNSYATKFEFLTSIDLVTWDSVEIKNNTVGGVPYSHSFGSARKMARYIAVRAHLPNGANQSGGQMAIAEFEALARGMPATADSISIKNPPSNLAAGKTVKLQAEVLPADAVDRTASWSSSDTSVATVNADGVVTALRAGTATLTATDAEGHAAQHTLTVKKASNLALNKPSEMLKVNLTDPLSAQPSAPAASGNDGSVATRAQAFGQYAWAYLVDLGGMRSLDGLAVTFGATLYATKFELLVSSDRQNWNSVGIIDGSTGGVRYQADLDQVQARYAVIRALAPSVANQPGGQMSIAEFEAYAYDAAVLATGVQMDASTLIVAKDNKVALQASVMPANADNTFIQWSSSNASVASVDAQGVLTALAPGTAVVTAATEDGHHSAQRTVSVRNAANIALQKAAKATTANMQTTLNTHASTPSSAGNDGNLATRAQASGAFAWAYQIDLGEERLLSRLAVTFPSTLFATQFDFLTSKDGSTWTVAASYTDVDGTAKIVKDLGAGTIARYAAVRAIKPNAAGQTGGQMAISEFEIYSPANAAPTGIALSGDTVSEGLPAGAAVATIEAADPDAADRHTFALVGGTGGDDNGAFTIEGNQLKTNAVFDLSQKETYRIRIQAKDASGAAFEKLFVIQVAPGPDTEPPAKPASLAISDIGRSSLQLAWAPSADNVGVVSYDIFVGSALRASVSGTTYAYTVTGLSAGTPYTLRVVAKDEAGNESEPSDPASATTLAVAASVTLDRTALTLDPYAHPSETLHATVFPANAVDKSVAWSSSDSAVATVNEHGIVTAVAPGTATVTATTIEGGHTAGADVRVNPSVAAMLTGVSQAYEGQSFTLDYGLGHVASSVSAAVYAQALTFGYDPDKLEFLGATSLRGGIEIVRAEATSPGVVSVIAASQGGTHALTTDGSVLRLSWKARPAAQNANTAIELTEVLLSDGLGQETPVASNTHALQILYVDKSALAALIAAAQSTLTSAVEGVAPGQYPAGSKAALSAAIEAARAVADRTDAPQQETDAAADALQAALLAFQNAVIVRLVGDLNGDGLIRVGDLGILAANYGKSAGDADWASVSYADLNHDGIIDIFDMVALALKL